MFIILILLLLSSCGVCRNRLCINTCDKDICYSNKIERELMECKKDVSVATVDLEKQAYKVAGEQVAKERAQAATKRIQSRVNDYIFTISTQNKEIDKLTKQIGILESQLLSQKKEYYWVVEGESLSAIAASRNIHNDCRKWPLILWGNPFIKDYKKIYPDMKLLIKRDWGKEDIKRAIQVHYDQYPIHGRGREK